MEFIRGTYNLRARHRGCIASIGNYDGVHLGHQRVLRQLVEHAASFKLPSLVICFEPTPREFFAGDRAPVRLSTFRDKYERFRVHGIDRFLCIHFNGKVARMDPEAFVRVLLVDGIGVRRLVVGDDFRFGHDRAGDFRTLVEAGARYGFEVEDTPSYNVDGRRVSSTMIREALESGDFRQAERLLGRPYEMSGAVIHGDRLGREIGFPTANLRIGRHRSPMTGIFAVRVRGLGPLRHGVANLGTRPTVDGRELLLEVHIFDFEETIYGRRIEVEFVERLRDELRFESIELMTQQMHRDAEQARDILAGAG